METLLQNPVLTGGFRQLATQRGDLLLQEGDLCCEICDLPFALRGPSPGEANLKHAWAERSLARAIQLGEYGVHYVPSPPDVSLLKARAEDPRALARILEHSEWPGLLILDTKSDLSFNMRVGDMPTTFLYNAEGVEVARVTGAYDWEGEEAKALIAEAIGG